MIFLAKFNFVNLMLASCFLIIPLVANVEKADAGITSYLPSMKAFNPFYWLGSAKNSNATQLAEDPSIKRFDDHTPASNYSLNSTAKSSNIGSVGGTELKMSLPLANNGTILHLVPTTTTTTARPLVVHTTTGPGFSTGAPALAAAAATGPSTTFPPGSVKVLFTTKKPNILINKPPIGPLLAKKYKILKNGKMYDMWGRMPASENNVSLSSNNNSSGNSYQYPVVAFDLNEDKKENQTV